MDLNTIESICVPKSRCEVPAWQPNDAFLAGGSWLFSEPQVGVRRLIDLTRLGWPQLAATTDGLHIAATCTIARLNSLECPADWRAAPLIRQCCRALLGSFKIWNVATVGGNLCMALPAGPMISLAAALEGICTIWMPAGGERHVRVADFIFGPQANVLAAGEILRSIDIPVEALRRRTAFRRISLSVNGRSGALVIGTLTADKLVLTITAATRRPVQLRIDCGSSASSLAVALDHAISPVDWYGDVHGRPDWRAHVTGLLAEEIRAELAGGDR